MANKPTYEDLKKRVKKLEREVAERKNLAESIEKSAEKFIHILDGIEEGYYEVDPAGNFTFFNETMCRIFGYSRDELMGMNNRAYTSAKIAKKVYKVYSKVYKTGNPAKILDYEVIRKDGSVVMVEASASLLRDSSGKPIGFQGILRDRTEQKKAENALRQSEESYRSLLALAPDSITITRIKDSRLLQINEAFCQHTGYSPEEAIGRTALELNLYVDPNDRKRVYEALEQHGRFDGMEIRYQAKDGTILNDLTSARTIRFQGEDCVLNIATNINSLKEVQRALRESEESYRSVLGLSPDIITITRIEDGNYLQVNEAFCQLTGYSVEEVIGRTPAEINLYADPSDRQVLMGALRQHGRVDGMEIRFRVKDGSIRESLMSSRPVRFQGEDCIMSVNMDITSLKKAEQARRESEEKYRNILESIEEGYYEVDLSGNFTFANEALCGFYGLLHDELIGRNYQELTSPEARERIYRIFNVVYRAGIPAHIVEFEFKRADGSMRKIEGSVSLLRKASGESIGFYGITRDRTELKMAEEALRESEESYRSILALAPDAITITRTVDNRLVRVNEAFCQHTGYSAEEAIGQTALELNLWVDPVDRERVNEALRQHGGVDGMEVRFQAKDGTILNDLLSNRPIRFQGEDCVLTVATNINLLKKAQRALRENEEKYRLVVDNAHEGIYITQDGVVKFSNPRIEELTGYSTEELAGIPFVNLVHPEDKKPIIEKQQKKLEGEKRPSPYSFRIRNRANETLWVELNTIPIDWQGRPADLNFLRDITPQKRMEAQFLQAQKMEAVGTLAGGIAHDFNNLLMGIQGNASLILLDIESHHPHYAKLRSIEQIVKGGAELTKQLLGVARGGKYELKATNLNNLVEMSADLFGRTRKEISVHKLLQQNVWPVEVDRSQIEQVLLNLYVNAWHAMPDGGELYLETRNVTLDEYYVRPYGVAPGKYVKISVTDTGVGMDEATKRRVFDPFFTTKEMGRGTGLGLASAYGIVKNHSGIINVYSEKGEGTTFNIYLPMSEKDILEETDSRQELLKGTESILFVDDEEVIIEIGQQLLEKLGYRVISANSGPEAVEVFRREGDRIDLVVLDMIMPGMSGGETYDRLKEINPQVKVLLASGYSLNGQAKAILDRGCKGFLQKPFNMADLSKKVRKILEE